jgi:folate-binding protein YgfZ
MPDYHLSDRAIIRLSPTEPGEDVRGFLQGLVTQDTAGELALWAALLSPQGKALFDFLLWADNDDVLIDAEAEQAEALVRRLSMYRLRRKIAIAIDPTLTVYWSATEPDEGARRHNSDLGPWPTGIRPDPRNAALGYRWLSVPADPIGDATVAYRAHRLGLGITEGVTELGSDQTLWLECNAAELNGVSFNKGCYVGQENTARMNWRQKVNRRLVVVPIDQSNPKRQRIAYPDLGLSVEHWRAEDMTQLQLPEWLPNQFGDPDE